MAERNTMQKEIIYSALCRMANHPTADDVYNAVHESHPSISRATVFRVLNKLADNGTVYKVNIANGADHFDHQTFRHYHAHCKKCGSVCDVKLADILPEDSLVLNTSDDSIVAGTSALYDINYGSCFNNFNTFYFKC